MADNETTIDDGDAEETTLDAVNEGRSKHEINQNETISEINGHLHIASAR